MHNIYPYYVVEVDLTSLEGSGGLPLELESIVDVSVGAPALRFNPSCIGIKYFSTVFFLWGGVHIFSNFAVLP